MPELPEVETVLQSLKPHMEGATVQDVVVRQKNLRWPIPDTLKQLLTGKQFTNLARRGKYLLMPIADGTLLIHLGMSGSLRIVSSEAALKPHDHVDIRFSNTQVLRYYDPRRFGCMLWTSAPLDQHPLLKKLGPEPLDASFSASYLFQRIKNRKTSIKELIMNSQVVVGVGNIYAAEALFLAKIHPLTPACHLSFEGCALLVESIVKVLKKAITKGGTTVKDFINTEGKPGYFAQELQVYGRAGTPCLICQTPLQSLKIGQRSTVFCEHCQKR